MDVRSLEHWSLCRCALSAMSVTGSILCGVSLYTMAAISVDRLLAMLLRLRYKEINFKAHIYYFSYRLGCMSSGWFIISSQVPNWPFVQLYGYIILPSNLNHLVRKDFSRSQSSSGSNTRFRSTTAEPTKSTEYDAIQKGSVQCTVGAVSFSCLLCTTIYSRNYDLS